MVPKSELEEDRTNSWTAVLSAQSDLGGRDLGLEIDVENGGLILRIYPSERLSDKFPVRQVPLGLDKEQLSAAVIACQAAWWNCVIEHHSPFQRYPFHRKAENPVSEKEYRDQLLPKLAEAGEELFVQVFRPARPDLKDTRAVGKTLSGLLAQPDLRIRVRSRRFIVPWNFMYPGDIGNPSPEGFWGCRHLIEHDVDASSPSNAPFAPSLRIAAHFDLNLDTNPRFAELRCLQGFRDMLADYGIKPTERNTRADFSKALRKCADEHIFYFCCHARSGEHAALGLHGPELFLTDPNEPKLPITPNNVHTWLSNCEDLLGRPLVFINACEAVKSGSIYFEGFAEKFLDHFACAVVGPELEIPVIFAREFAQHFFSDFFRGGTENSVGSILLRRRREYLTKFQNPLGLAYSLYRGGDLTLERPLGIQAARAAAPIR
jgi:hypothetical protein